MSGIVVAHPDGTFDVEFDAIQLIDDHDDGPHSGTTPGADIDAVGAIATIPV